MKNWIKKNWIKRGIVGFLSVALVFTFASCGGETSDEPASETLEKLTVAFNGALTSLDPNQEAGDLNYYVAPLITDGLVTLDNAGEIQPALAESWEQQESKWVFTIRENAKFSNGNPVTPEDIIYSINIAKDETISPGTAPYFPQYIKKTEKTGDREITITLDGEHASFLIGISNAGGLFVRPESWQKEVEGNNGTVGSAKDLLIGSGPYKVVSFDPTKGLSLTANENYYGTPPEVKDVQIDFIEDANTRYAAFKDGEVDFALSVPIDQVSQWEGVEGASVEKISNRSTVNLMFDPNVGEFKDEHVRKAFAYANNAASYVSGVLKNYADVATALPNPEQFVPAGLSLDDAKKELDGVFHYEYDIEKAKEELAQSEYPDGFETTLTYPDTYPEVGKVALAYADDLKQIGVTLKVKEQPIGTWANEVGNNKQGVAWMIYLPTTPEPAEVTSWLLAADGTASNPTWYKNDEVKKLNDDALAAPTLEGQIPYVIEGNSIAQEEAIYAPVYWGNLLVGVSGNVSFDDFNSYSHATNSWPSLFSAK